MWVRTFPKAAVQDATPGATELWWYRCGVVQRVADGRIGAVGHGSQRKLSMPANQMKDIWVRQPEEGIPLCPDTWLASILGMTVEVKQVHNGQVGQEEVPGRGERHQWRWPGR